MEVIRVGVVHDDAATRVRLRSLLEQESGIELVGESAEATPFLRANRPHLVFLNVSGHGGVPFEARGEGALPLLVVVSPHDADAVHAFEAGALDYLLQPFTEARFRQSLERARERVHELEILAHSSRLLHLLQQARPADRPAVAPGLPLRNPLEERLVVKTGSRLVFLDADEIDWIESEGVYVRLHIGARSYLLRESLQNAEARLHPKQFLRIHRSTIVNVDRIKEIIPHFNGGAIVLLRDGTKLKLSRSYRNRVNATLG